MNCCNDYGRCTRGNDCPARCADPELVKRINATMPSMAEQPVELESEVEIKAIWLMVGAFVCGLLMVLPLSLPVLLVITGQKLGQLI
jgi:hypothetical protein